MSLADIGTGKNSSQGRGRLRERTSLLDSHHVSDAVRTPTVHGKSRQKIQKHSTSRSPLKERVDGTFKRQKIQKSSNFWDAIWSGRKSCVHCSVDAITWLRWCLPCGRWSKQVASSLDWMWTILSQKTRCGCHGGKKQPCLASQLVAFRHWRSTQLGARRHLEVEPDVAALAVPAPLKSTPSGSNLKWQARGGRKSHMV